MAIQLVDIPKAVKDYFSSLVDDSIEITPDTGQTEINPGEDFLIYLTVKNSMDDPNQGVQLSNLRYHVISSDENIAKIIAPSPDIAIARKGPSSDSELMQEGHKEKEMFLFPPAPHDIVGAGKPGFLQIRGHARTTGQPSIQFDPHMDVNLADFVSNQQGPDTTGHLNIVD